MHNTAEQVWRTSRDLPNGWTRHTDFIWLDPDGQRWRFVPRRRVRRIAEDARREARVVMRFRPGYFPHTIEGAVVRSLLETPRTMRLDMMVRYCEKWDAEPWAFFLRAFGDDRALLSVVTRMLMYGDER